MPPELEFQARVVMAPEAFFRSHLRQTNWIFALVAALAVLVVWLVSEVRRLSTEVRVTQEYVTQMWAAREPDGPRTKED